MAERARALITRVRNSLRGRGSASVWEAAWKAVEAQRLQGRRLPLWRPGLPDAPHVLPFTHGHLDETMGHLESFEEDASQAHQDTIRTRSKYRILSLDGGGVRGVVTGILLHRIQQEVPGFLHNVDLVSGTSSGAIVGLLLASGYSPKQCYELYKHACPWIFEKTWARRLSPFRASYGDKVKKDMFQYYLGDRRLCDLRMTVCVIGFRLDGAGSKTHTFFDRPGWRPAVFSNMPRAAGVVEPDSDLYAWKAALRSSAAPTYFPVWDAYCDGGVVANNPSLIAVSKAMAHYPSVTPKNIVMLSLGSGHWVKQLDHRADRDWGLGEWVPYLLDLMFDGSMLTVEMALHYMLGGNEKRFHRMDPILPNPIMLDDVNKMKELEEIAWSVDLSETIAFAKTHFQEKDPREGDGVETNEPEYAPHYGAAWLQSSEAQIAKDSGRLVSNDPIAQRRQREKEKEEDQKSS